MEPEARRLKVIVGHSNMDLDCVASAVLARRLFPGFVPIRSRLVQPAARKLLNLYGDDLGFLPSSELKGAVVEKAVVVDTRSPSRIEEYFRETEGQPEAYEVFDHHPDEGRDIPFAVVHYRPYGSAATILALEARDRGVVLSEEDATVALAGIYADTGNFLHENVGGPDFEAAAFLASSGASVKLVKDFLAPLKERRQFLLLHEALAALEESQVRGHRVQSFYLELDDEPAGLAAVVERAFEVEDAELLFGCFFVRKKNKLLLIGRSSAEDVFLNELLGTVGGGGHKSAASASLKADDGRAAYARCRAALDAMLEPAAAARDIMTVAVDSVRSTDTLLEASLFLEATSHTGAPVLDAAGELVGFLTLRDIMRGRKAGRMRGEVREFMTRRVVTAPPSVPVREVDRILFENDVGHLPIVEGGRMVGLVTRGDYLAYRRRRERLRMEALGALRDGACPAGGTAVEAEAGDARIDVAAG